MKQKQKQSILLLFIICLNIFKGTWREIPQYKRGLLYISFLNSMYYYLCKRSLLWEFRPEGVRWELLRIVHIFIISPSIVLLFISDLPKSIPKKIVHLLKWVIYCSVTEYIILKLNMIRFKYGWNIYWSGLVYLKIFVYGYLYNKRPLLTFILSLFSAIFFTAKFKIPLRKRLLKGPFYLFLKYPRFPFESRFKTVLYTKLDQLKNKLT